METLKFVMTAAFYPPYHLGGDANHVRYLAEALVAQGHEVHVEYSPAALAIKRGRHPSPDPGPHGSVPAPRRMDLRRPGERPEASPRTRRERAPGRDSLPQPLVAGTGPNRRPQLRAQDVHGPRLLGALSAERPVQIQSTPLRQADVPHVPDDLREAAAAVALPARWAQALRRPRRRDRAERFPARDDRPVPPRPGRPHPELRARSEPFGASEFAGRLLPVRRPPRVLQRNSGARERGEPVPRTAPIRRRRKRETGGRPGGGAGTLGPAGPPWLVAGRRARCDLCAGARPAASVDLV